MKDGKNRTWIRTVTALAAVGGILGLFGCTGTAGNQQMERVPLLMAYEQGNPSWYMIDLTNQIYDFSEITLDYSSGASHEIIGLDSQMQPVDSAAIGDKPFVFAPEEGMAYIAFSVDEAGGESVSAEGTLSQEGMEARGQNTIATSRFAGKNMSVLGDSISAFAGYIPTGYEPQYPSGDVGIPDMWWYRVAGRLGMNVCKINACSGSGVTEYAWAYRGVGRLPSDVREADLHQMEEQPDVIFIWLGANDVFGGAPEDVIRENYRNTVEKTQENYPKAEIYLCTYYNTGSESIWLNEYIRQLSGELGVGVADVERCGITAENSEKYIQSDGLHPNKAGFQLIGAWITEELLKDGGSNA